MSGRSCRPLGSPGQTTKRDDRAELGAAPFGARDAPACRFVTAKTKGEWVANFSIPGDQPREETTRGIDDNTIVAEQFDDDSNVTAFFGGSGRDDKETSGLNLGEL